MSTMKSPISWGISCAAIAIAVVVARFVTPVLWVLSLPPLRLREARTLQVQIQETVK